MSKLRMLVLLASISVTSSRACLWDSETIYVERIGFPSDIRMILGAFLVRSDSFHLHRKALSLQKIADSAKATPLDYDNLAVSMDKLHRDDSAIVVMKSKRLRYGPAYETMASMGTIADMKQYRGSNFENDANKIEAFLKGPEEEADPYEGLETEIDLGEFDPDEDPPAWKSSRWKQYGKRR